MDCVHDQLATGHELRVLTTLDIFSRFSLALQRRSTSRWPCQPVNLDYYRDVGVLARESQWSRIPRR